VGLASDLKIIYHMAVHPIRGGSHKERLESFYSGQASGYDDFRKRLLKGREQLYRSVPMAKGDVWLDLGGGTGSNLEYVKGRIPGLGKVYVVDLSTSLLKVARERFARNRWSNVEGVEADVTVWVPPEKQVDVVTFSYSLTMIPDWFAAIDHALRLLKPGGHIGVVDFTVSRKHASAPNRQHPWFTRTFWPAWFAMDNVFPNPDHLPYLQRRFERESLIERIGSVPYIPLIKMPYYQFVGRKRAE